MKKGLDEKRLRQIWKYNIEPFIEDQFFGDADQIADFEFDAVLGRYLDGLGVTWVDQLVETDDGVVGVVPEAVEGEEPEDATEPPIDD
jgi:5-methylcytosine-specific restriction protein B